MLPGILEQISMSLNLSNILPWGRSYAEYLEMFSLSENDLNKRILSCADGLSSFNAEASALGLNILSCDPVYQYDISEIKLLIKNSYQEIISGIEKHQGNFFWKRFANIQALSEYRKKVFVEFFDHFSQLRNSDKYLQASLPNLPFNNDSIDLLLISHFLFLYTENINFELHCTYIKECLRVSKEMRIYPLATLNNEPYPHLTKIINHCESLGFTIYTEEVAYRFLKSANEMLVIKKK